MNKILPTLGLEEKLILEEKVILEDGPSGLVKSDLTNHPPPHSRRNHPTDHIAGATIPPTTVDMDCCSATTGQIIAKIQT